MKSAYLLSYDANLIAKVRDAIRATGRHQWEGYDVVYEGDDAIQVRLDEADNRFTLEDFSRFVDNAWTYEDAPHFPEPGVTPPDLTRVVPYDAVCRAEAEFARLVRAVAELSGEPAWVLDGNDVLWDARNVDPDRVLL